MTNLKTLTKTVEELDFDLRVIAEEHDRYRLNSSNEDEAMNWLHSLPIETLSESLDKEHLRPRTKYSFNHMSTSSCFASFMRKRRKNLSYFSLNLNVAKIDCLLNR